MGAFWEAAAMAFHALGARDQQNQAYAVAHRLVFLLAPLCKTSSFYSALTPPTASLVANIPQGSMPPST